MKYQEEIKTKFKTFFEDDKSYFEKLIICWLMGQFFKDKITDIKLEKMQKHFKEIKQRLNHGTSVLLMEEKILDKSKAGVTESLYHLLHTSGIDLYEFYYYIFYKLAKANAFTDGNKRASFIFLHFFVVDNFFFFDNYFNAEKLLKAVVADKEGSKEEFIQWIKDHEKKFDDLH